VTVMVVNSRGVPPAEATPFFTTCACRPKVILHGAASFQVVATPISGAWMPASVMPIAYRYERCGARSGPSVTWRLGSRDFPYFLSIYAGTPKKGANHCASKVPEAPEAVCLQKS